MDKDAEILRLRAEVAALRKALESIAANTCCDKCQEAALVARAALDKPLSGPTRFTDGHGNSLDHLVDEPPK